MLQTIPLLIGTPLILVSLWVVANDPTVQTWRRRMRLEAALRKPSEGTPLEEVIDAVAVFPQAEEENVQHRNRRRAGGRMKSSFRRKPSYQKRKAR
jgi:hypothetical protein